MDRLSAWKRALLICNALSCLVRVIRVCLWLLSREFAGLGDNVDRFRDLRIVRFDEHAVAHDAAVRRRHEIEPQLELDEGPVTIDNRGRSLEVRIAGDEVAESTKHRVGDFEFVRLEFVIEVDARDLARLETLDASVDEFA